ncbi:3-isopropylmalate dehydratase large subunit [Bordetella genomosp. 12]|uniref:3-isopropylmalate dehydratase n=1 Tax=Bordetella genomosp. 12 TaxID=463035 RepID=A0A261VBB7_9BORD|nr:3-isopropylmalate dehydratase large subunit [Bordetella genomosp. 12]OZI71456.1 3-isopropylmalate dehydratase large subunit [Bordetella genomosp. 12]
MTTLFDKIWVSHSIARNESGEDLIYIDRHLVQEVSSPQAFASMAESGHTLRSSARHIAVQDHNVPTTADRLTNIPNEQSRIQIATLRNNTQETGMRLFDLDHPLQGIVHVIAPELGYVLPGSTVVCGDSHSATLGAMGALAWGIGTSEVAHVMSTQSLWMKKPRTMGVRIAGALPLGTYAKDLALALVHQIGTSGGTGYSIEYHGPTIDLLSMEARLTLCNMTIEAGSRFGLIAPDSTTLDYLRDRVTGAAREHFNDAVRAWSAMRTDSTSDYDREIEFDASALAPLLTWGTTPSESTVFSGRVGDGADYKNQEETRRLEESLLYMGLRHGQAISSVPIDVAFIGSCTNGRLEDLRAAAEIARGRKVAKGVRALVVPGSSSVKRAAEAEGLAQVFVDAGFEWRESGCSMCIGMNGDSLSPGERCASTSNRNFENRQGQGGRTHLMSPAAVAASALQGKLTDPREYIV